MSELLALSLADTAEGLRRGDFSSNELTQSYLSRIDTLEPDLNAFIHVTPEIAQSQAEAADERLAAWRDGTGIEPPFLCGVPLAIKDVLTVKGAPATAGSRILEGFMPTYHATSVAQLFEAGMVMLGKTNTDEFAMGSSTENSAYGVTHNPWNLDRVPGGSSGGSAAAIAARLAPLAMGTDTGGSIRQPASFCGVTGLKTTYGRVSRYGLIAYASSLDTVGALAPSAAELVPIYQTIAGHDPLDSTTVDIPVPPVNLEEPSLKGLRVGVPQEYFIEGIQAEVSEAVRRAIQVFWSLGAEVVDVSLPHTDLA
ncbi:MAG: amidase, partial [Anaerolineales bacterium]